MRLYAEAEAETKVADTLNDDAEGGLNNPSYGLVGLRFSDLFE